MIYSRPLSVLLCSFLLLSGCGDNGANDNNEQPLPQADCARLELESFDDCTFEQGVHFGQPETIEGFCDSACNQVFTLRATGPGGTGARASRDLKLLERTVEIEDVLIENMENLETLDGLDELTHVRGGFRVRWNPELRNLEALSSLESVAMGDSPQYDMYLYGNPKLETLDGLESLKDVGMALIIDEHANLRSIEALESLVQVKALKITDNPKLPTCQAEALAERLELPDDKVEIRGNGTGSCD